MGLRKRSITIIVVLLVIVIGAGLAGFYYWWMNSPKFVLKATVDMLPIQEEVTRCIRYVSLSPEQKAEQKERCEKCKAKYKLPGDIFIYCPDCFESPECAELQVIGHITKGYKVAGTLINNSIREFSDINIKLAVYNGAKNQIGIFNIHIDNLQPHKTCKFNETLDQQLFDNGASFCEVAKITAKR